MPMLNTRAPRQPLRHGKTILTITLVIFTLANLAAVAWCFTTGDMYNVWRGLLLTPVMLLIPALFRLGRLRPCYRLYVFLYAFILYAFTFGCVLAGYNLPVTDKIAHGLSGMVFTLVGFVLFYLLRGPKPRGIKDDWVMAFTYALFFSLAIAVFWEIGEFAGYVLYGRDAQRHLTTGVFDTMGDLIACLAGSLASVVSFLLYRFRGVRLLTGALVEEFYVLNVQDGTPQWAGFLQGTGRKGSGGPTPQSPQHTQDAAQAPPQ